jgi:protein Mpv17
LAAVTAFGVVGMGPMGHVWYILLDKVAKRVARTNLQMVVTKVAGDTFVFGPVCLWLFFASVSVMEGTEWETIRRKLWRDFVPTSVALRNTPRAPSLSVSFALSFPPMTGWHAHVLCLRFLCVLFLLPRYIIDYSFWPIVQGTNFYFIPVRHQLLFVNTVCYFDDIFLTYVQHNELPRLFKLVEEWWEGFYERNLLSPGEKMEDIFTEDEDD